MERITDSTSHNTYDYIIKMILPQGRLESSISVCHGLHDIKRMKEALCVQERTYYNALRYNKRMNSYLMGRYVAKRAVSQLTQRDLTDIVIDNGIFNQPVIRYQGHMNIEISLTHCEDFASAIAYPDTLIMGIDIERINAKKNDVFRKAITSQEKEIHHSLGISEDAFLVLMWSIKESLSKALKTGLTVPFHILESKSIRRKGDLFISEYQNFYQYYAISFFIGSYIYTITYPKNVQLLIDAETIKKEVENIMQKGSI